MLVHAVAISAIARRGAMVLMGMRWVLRDNADKGGFVPYFAALTG
jgi:hypothetical protein